MTKCFSAMALSALILFPNPKVSRAIDDYVLGTNSMFNPDVPQGKVTVHRWENSKIFPGTVRDYWTYVPAQYDPAKPACVMVFQDGEGYVRTNGSWRVPYVFDNLIARQELPVIVGIFINPGVLPSGEPAKDARKNRSVEYDSLGDAYARFLLEEILPEVGMRLNLTTNAASRAICGASSGGICAFTVAWERSQEFSKVLSTIGSFTDIRGGFVYPFLIRKEAPRPIRVFLQDGSNDLDNRFGNWPLANQTMAAALKFAKYDYLFVYGDGAHNAKHGAAIFPEAVKWLWRDHPR